MKPAMIIDLNRCVGCYACVEACITENIARIKNDFSLSLPPNPPQYARTRPHTITSETNRRRVFIQCLHCENPPCVYVCPTGASYRSPEGVVLLNDSTCIRCGLCIDACPYGVRTRLLEDFPGQLLHQHALKTGIPDKCTFCYHKKTEDKIWSPACVDACSFEARLFGDLDDPQDPVSRLVRSGLAVQPRTEFKTEPKVYYVPRKGAFELVKYPAQTTSATEFRLWYTLKNSLLQPVIQMGMLAAVVLGAVHIIRERMKKGGGHGEKHEADKVE
ncbi:MAG: 4Fe-4S dicluster domain-containing protein [Candidatus Caldarchaeum sp.]|nr:4Fe-4S dicluster domain-containing protein [Candidatus Caldarchaeum sp.]MDW8063551.1 4Fe-4S dicluster domain-containing protein [Candidatus Caldarchaeum sp.]MDW8436105.1 4Fe-4S dicluster domain-containing protein [Candidatus Caldarchaeum sp.]